ncbi:PqqD family protein [Bradyrhizobium sp.]|uniref:PqqD family protein n=1 Tax=Bradyrhizobium sp. TaxID=376 RepID=UPI0039E49A5F
MDIKTFRIKPSTVHDTFGDETVIVNLDTGSYYSAQGSASAVWRLVGEGVPDRTIVDHYTAAHPSDASDVARALADFFAQLVAESLVEVDASAGGEPGPAPIAAAKPDQSFVPPVLQKYTDMEEMLLLDPVHEVDEQGWPTTRKQLD